MNTGIPRCQRCATLLRNDRKVCPSCGLSLTSQSSSEPDAPSAVTASAPEKKAPRANLKICPACTHSVAAEEMAEFEGQQYCADCAKGLRAKAEKRKAS